MLWYNHDHDDDHDDHDHDHQAITSSNDDFLSKVSWRINQITTSQDMLKKSITKINSN